MNTFPGRSLAFATVCLLAVTVASAAKPAARNVDRFVRTKQRLDALLQHRVNPGSLPAVLPNPFQITGATPATGGTPSPEASPLTDETELLARHAANLKIGGILEFNGRVQLMINQIPRKEGDLIIISDGDNVIYLQVVRLTTRELTLGYKDAVQVIPLKGG